MRSVLHMCAAAVLSMVAAGCGVDTAGDSDPIAITDPGGDPAGCIERVVQACVDAGHDADRCRKHAELICTPDPRPRPDPNPDPRPNPNPDPRPNPNPDPRP